MLNTTKVCWHRSAVLNALANLVSHLLNLTLTFTLQLMRVRTQPILFALCHCALSQIHLNLADICVPMVSQIFSFECAVCAVVSACQVVVGTCNLRLKRDYRKYISERKVKV